MSHNPTVSHSLSHGTAMPLPIHPPSINSASVTFAWNDLGAFFLVRHGDGERRVFQLAAVHFFDRLLGVGLTLHEHERESGDADTKLHASRQIQHTPTRACVVWSNMSWCSCTLTCACQSCRIWSLSYCMTWTKPALHSADRETGSIITTVKPPW